MTGQVDLEAIYRAEAGRVRASLIRLLGGFDAAEEALHDAFMAAAEHWPRDGMPDNPRAWLVSAGRFRAIDRIRRRVRHDALVEEIGRGLEEAVEDEQMQAEIIADDELRLIFTCCHPVLAPDQQVALALREICGLTTEQIAASFLTTPSTLAQRIVRAKNRIRDAEVPYAVPERDELPSRLVGVLHTIYLVFNEGYSAPVGGADLAHEAIRLGRLLAGLLPEPDAVGLLALMLLNESRRAARTDGAGDIVLLADQDRGLWDRAMIAEGAALAERAMSAPGGFAIEAKIGALHALSPDAASTDWAAIAGWYDVLFELRPTPVVALNRAVAIAERDGAAAGLAIVDGLLAGGALANYHLAHATRAEFCRRLGEMALAREAYARALDLARDPADVRFLRRRLGEVG
ncbi:MAG TPA: RNA polymerase sigma factor [Devosia sp.]|nr:RNA polymerase sigma factor [Devosia sp.]